MLATLLPGVDRYQRKTSDSHTPAERETLCEKPNMSLKFSLITCDYKFVCSAPSTPPKM